LPSRLDRVMGPQTRTPYRDPDEMENGL
jgi:hypothetical protein